MKAFQTALCALLLIGASLSKPAEDGALESAETNEIATSAEENKRTILEWEALLIANKTMENWSYKHEDVARRLAQERAFPSSPLGIYPFPSTTGQLELNDGTGISCVESPKNKRIPMPVFVDTLRCAHVNKETCFASYVTKYLPEKKEVCRTTFKKDCHIDFEDAAMDVKLLVCKTPTRMACDFTPTYSDLEVATYIAHALSRDTSFTGTSIISDSDVSNAVANLQDTINSFESTLNGFYSSADWDAFLAQLLASTTSAISAGPIADPSTPNAVADPTISAADISHFANWFHCEERSEVICETTYVLKEDIQTTHMCTPDVIQMCMDDDECVAYDEYSCGTPMTLDADIYRPLSKCRTELTWKCGPRVCPPVPGTEVCSDEVKTITYERPYERCDLVPQKRCKFTTQMVPYLKPTEICQFIPNEVCAPVRERYEGLNDDFNIDWWCGLDADSGETHGLDIRRSFTDGEGISLLGNSTESLVIAKEPLVFGEGDGVLITAKDVRKRIGEMKKAMKKARHVVEEFKEVTEG